VTVNVSLRWEVVCDHCGRGLALPESHTLALLPGVDALTVGLAADEVINTFARTLGSWLGAGPSFTCGTWVPGAQPCPEQIAKEAAR
jgi:hypothetical protein